MNDPLRLIEAAIFASAEPVSRKTLDALLPEGEMLDPLLDQLVAAYADRGVRPEEVAGGWAFRTAPDLAGRLRRVVEVPRKLSRAALETLAIVAYHQPVTRTEIEALRGASLSQAILDALIGDDLITPAGRRESPGRPALWATTQGFLLRFGLTKLGDLPARGELMVEPAVSPPRAEPAVSPPRAEPAVPPPPEKA